jgi:hypothetical protein
MAIVFAVTAPVVSAGPTAVTHSPTARAPALAAFGLDSTVAGDTVTVVEFVSAGVAPSFAGGRRVLFRTKPVLVTAVT